MELEANYHMIMVLDYLGKLVLAGFKSGQVFIDLLPVNHVSRYYLCMGRVVGD